MSLLRDIPCKMTVELIFENFHVVAGITEMAILGGGFFKIELIETITM